MSTPQPEPRTERRFPVRTLGAVSASVLAFPLASAPSDAGTFPYPKPAKALPTTLDVAPGYQKGTQCLTESQPGAVAFAKLLNSTYGSRTYGILRHCAAEHGEGRALDWMINASNAEQLALANALTRWLAAPDAQGRPGAMAKRFGINYIIWNRQMWRAYDPARGWAPYYGVSPHTDHIHFSFNWDGAYKRTSWWTGVAVTKPLTGPTTTVTPPPAPVITASGYPLLEQGATGPDVALAQKVIGVTADGKFGPIDGDRPRCVADEARRLRDEEARQRHVVEDGRAQADPEPRAGAPAGEVRQRRAEARLHRRGGEGAAEGDRQAHRRRVLRAGHRVAGQGVPEVEGPHRHRHHRRQGVERPHGQDGGARARPRPPPLPPPPRPRAARRRTPSRSTRR